jgi:hypothetical protein
VVSTRWHRRDSRRFEDVGMNVENNPGGSSYRKGCGVISTQAFHNLALRKEIASYTYSPFGGYVILPLKSNIGS